MSGFSRDPSFYVISGYGADQGFTEDEAYALLAGLDDTSSTAVMPIVAAANTDSDGEEHTGAMVALVPSDADIERLAIDDGEAADQLHLTLMFLGEAAAISEETREKILSAVQRYATGSVNANGFSINVFNPASDNSCIVMGVGNDDGTLSELQSNVASTLRGLSGLTVPTQHMPWIPHITLAYTDDFDEVEELATRTGPIVFDRIRVAFGGQVHDIPLGEPVTASAETKEFAERDVNAPGGGHGLRNYWTKGEGAAKIRWGTDGAFARCVDFLSDRVRSPQGLCAEYHKAATGEWPAEKGVESGGTMMELTTEGVILTAAQKVATSEDEPWEGVLTVEGEESGDSRLFGLGSLDWAELPMPLMYQPASVGGHDASVLAGAITFAARKGNSIVGRGHVFGNMLDSAYGDGIRNMMKTGGVSVDVDKVKDADVEMVFSEDDGAPNLLAKPELTVFHRGRIRGATLVAFPAFVEAKLSFTNEAMLTASGESCGCTKDAEAYVLTAASHTITIPDLPKAEWFQEPTDVESFGALTITDEGRVFGWLAPASVTHRSVRKTVPMGGNVDYTRFMKGETIVEGGGRVVTGVVTGDCGHADTENYGTLANRKRHYDNSCSVFANIAVGQRPGKGVWVAGALRHGVTSEQVATAMGCSLSGDWQPHPDRAGVQEFIAALLVPVPGFAKARTQASVKFEDGVLTAAMIPVQFGEEIKRSEADIAWDLLTEYKNLLIASLELDPQSRKDAAMADLEME